MRQTTSSPSITLCFSARISVNGQAGFTSSGPLLFSCLPLVYSTSTGKPANAGQRMQHDEAGAVGGEVGFRRAGCGKFQTAVGAAADRCVIDQRIARVAAFRPVRDRDPIL